MIRMPCRLCLQCIKKKVWTKTLELYSFLCLDFKISNLFNTASSFTVNRRSLWIYFIFFCFFSCWFSQTRMNSLVGISLHCGPRGLCGGQAVFYYGAFCRFKLCFVVLYKGPLPFRFWYIKNSPRHRLYMLMFHVF